MDNPYEQHDAIEFPSGQVVLLTRLCEGQHATVLQLPASGTPEGAKDEVEAEPKRQRVIV